MLPHFWAETRDIESFEKFSVVDSVLSVIYQGLLWRDSTTYKLLKDRGIQEWDYCCEEAFGSVKE